MKWRCAWCGREHDSDDPPCETCGHETFEPASDSAGSAFDSGSLVWVCTDCGREHVKHSYLAGSIVVIGLVALVVTGVVPFPGLGGPPSPPDAPGDSQQSAGLELRVVETELHERFETEREQAGASERAFGGDNTDVYIEFRTRHRVAEQHDTDYDGSIPDTGAFDLRCGSQPRLGILTPAVDIDAFDDESSFVDALASELLTDDSFRDAVLDDAASEGITVHVAPDGTVFIGYMAC